MAKDKSIQKYVGQQVQRHRKQAKLTQSALSEFLGMSRASITNIEAGRQALDANGIYWICCALGCTMSDLFPQVKIIEIHIVEVQKTTTKQVRKLIRNKEAHREGLVEKMKNQ